MTAGDEFEKMVSTKTPWAVVCCQMKDSGHKANGDETISFGEAWHKQTNLSIDLRNESYAIIVDTDVLCKH